MSVLTFIGDVHGHFKGLRYLMSQCSEDDFILQIGDMEVGFPGYPCPNPFCYNYDIVADNFKFIRGNHDNPDVCLEHPQYAGHYGYMEEYDLFFLGGAHTPSKLYKAVPYVNWWPDEQLSTKDFSIAEHLYLETKPRIVVTHDAPFSVKSSMFPKPPSGELYHTDTCSALEKMFQAHQPEHWIFGHWHRNAEDNINGTHFRCVDILDTYSIVI